MGRCYECCQENCGYGHCSCSCHEDEDVRIAYELPEAAVPPPVPPTKKQRQHMAAQLRRLARAIEHRGLYLAVEHERWHGADERAQDRYRLDIEVATPRRRRS